MVIAKAGYGKPIQQISGVLQEQAHRALEVSWMPPRADDHSKASSSPQASESVRHPSMAALPAELRRSTRNELASFSSRVVI